MGWRFARTSVSRYRAAAVPISFGLALTLLSPLHDLFSEWGGVMQYFAGREILAGQGYHGWTSHFWPPLFSILIGLGSLVVPGFLAGKVISIAASAILLYVAYRLALDVSNSQVVALWTQVFLALSPWYVYESLRAHNHMIDALFFVWGLWFFVRSLGESRGIRLVVAGVLCGLAGLCRYTSYALLLLPIFSLAVPPRSGLFRTVRIGLFFWGGFGLISLPWWYYNTVTNGSPVYSWEYLNVCSSVMTDRPHTMAALWWCSDQPLAGAMDIVISHPLRYVTNVIVNIPQVGVLFVKWAGVLAVFVIPGVFASLLNMPARWVIVLFGMLGAYGLLLSQSHVVYWYLLPWAVVAVLVSVMFMSDFATRLEQRWPVARRYRTRELAVGVLIAGGILLSSTRLASYSSERVWYQPLVDEKEITSALRVRDSSIDGKIIMAIDPARAYYAGTGYLETPLNYEGSVAGMVSYEGLSESVRRYAPKHPSNLPNGELKADYLIYTAPPWGWGMAEISEFSFLLDPGSDRVPRNFIPVYRSPRVVVYEIRR